MKEQTASGDCKMGIGPQYHGDGPFQRRMRFHQSWYRHEVLAAPYGTGPKRTDTTYYGNMLSADAAAAGLNFLTPRIHGLAIRRMAEGSGAVDSFRLLRNMLSSQPMCFNLLGFVALDHNLGTRLVRSLWGTHVERVTAVRFEWAPAPRREYLNDATAFDAIIEYDSTYGPGFIGIETKLSEPFTPKVYDKREYRRWMGGDGPWRPDAYPRCSAREYNQLWRDHLLAWALLRHADSNHALGCLTVIHHEGDRECVEAIGAYRSLLRDDTTFRSFTLDGIVSKWQEHAPEWAAKFEERYLSLSRSAAVSS